MSQVVFVTLNWWQGSWNDWGLERNWNMAQTYTEGCLYLTRAPYVLILTQIDVQGSWNDWGLERRLLSTLFAITSLILGVQSWNFDRTWAPMVVTSFMNFSWLQTLLWKLACFMGVLRGSWKESTSMVFVTTLLILGVQGWNFDTIWPPVVVTSGMNFSALPPLLWELLPFLCVFENTKFVHRWPQWTCWGTIGWEIWNLTVDTCFGRKCTK